MATASDSTPETAWSPVAARSARIATVGQALCLASAALGAVVLAGWIFDLIAATALESTRWSMMPNTALGVLLLGLAAALRKRPDGKLRRPVALLAATFVLALAVATLAEYGLGIDLGIDQLLAAGEAGPFPGRPSPPTALGLALLALAIMLLDRRPSARARPSEWLALCAALLAFMVLVGNLFGAGPLYGLTGAPVVAVGRLTAIGQLMLALGLLLERPDAGVMRIATSSGPGGMLLRRLIPLAILAPLVLEFLDLNLLNGAEPDEYPLVFALLTGAYVVSALLLLAATAVRLDRVHRALERSRARTRGLIEQAPEGIFVADLEGRYIDVNGAGCHMLGFSREALLKMTVADLVRPEDAERLSIVKQQQLEGLTHVGEWQLRRGDGSYLPVELSAKILPDGRWQGFVRDISERKQAQERIRLSEERLDLALRATNLGSWDWNIETGKVIYNVRAASLLGYPEETSPSLEEWRSRVHRDDWPGVERALNDHLEGLTPDYENEHRMRTKDGRWIWIHARGRVTARGPRGEPLRMVGTSLDVTERKRAEAALRLAEAKSSGILAISADAIISVDEDQRITMFNEGAERIFGWSKAEVLGAPLDVLIPERFRERHRQHFERFAAGSESARRTGGADMPIFGLRKDGAEFPADATISKLEVGGTRLLTVALRDITAQQRLAREHRFLAEIGSQLAANLEYEDTVSRVANLAVRDLADFCAVLTVDDQGFIECLRIASRDASRASAAESLEGLVLDRGTPELVRWALDEKRTLVLREFALEDVPFVSGDEQLLRALRALEPRALILVPLRVRGKRRGAIALVGSSSSRCRGAADVDLAQELAYRAALSIENARLYRVARRAIRARDEVLGVVAHDLRNPLGTMLMQAELLRIPRRRAGRRSIKAAQVIERAATRMNRLIVDLLDVTRMEAGRLSIERAVVPAGQVVVDALEAERPLASAASLELGGEVAADTPEIFADRDRILQVLENLIGNAIKFTDPGGVVQAGAGRRDGSALFWVRDTGAGIPPEDLPHLFDRFWQGRLARRRGAGLGLPIVKGIVEAHGGRIWVESAPGQGSTFFFTIPSAA